jgi:hypothetical protein
VDEATKGKKRPLYAAVPAIRFAATISSLTGLDKIIHQGKDVATPASLWRKHVE